MTYSYQNLSCSSHKGKMHNFIKSQYLKIKVVALVKCLDMEPLLADEKRDFDFLDLLAVALDFWSISL